MGSFSKRKSTGMIKVDGGVDEYHDSLAIADNRKKRAIDIHIDGGEILHRPGKRLWGNVYADSFNGVHEYIDSNGTARLLIASGGSVYEDDGTTKTARDTGLSIETLHFHTYRLRAYYNGATTQRKISTTTAARIGIVAPASAPTVSGSGTGLTGLYGWKSTFVIEESGVRVWESDPSDSVVDTLTNQSGVVTPAASSDARVNARYIYRTTASGDLFQYSGKISNNTAGATYTDSVADADLGEILETTHGVPDQSDYSQGCNERMFWLDGYKLRWSEMAFTESYLEYHYTLNFKELITGGQGSGLKALYNPATQREDLYVFQPQAVSVLASGDPNYPLQTLSTGNKGCNSHDSIVAYGNALVFVSNKGTVEYLIGGRSIDITSRNIPVSIEKLIDKENIRASLVFDNFYAMCCRDDAGKLYKNCVWVCDLSSIKEVEPGYADAVWYKWNIDAEYILSRNDGTVLAFDNNTKRIWTLSLSDKTDESASTPGTYTVFVPEWETKDFNFGLFARVRCNELKVKGKHSNTLNVVATYGNDDIDTETSVLTNKLSSVAFKIGASKMGTPISVVSNVLTCPVPTSMAGNWVSFTFKKQTQDLHFKVSAMEVTYTAFQRV